MKRSPGSLKRQPPKLSIWKTRASKELFSVKPWITVLEQKVELPDGRRIFPFYRLELPSFVTVVARTEEGLLLMERQYKHGAGRVSLIFPSGVIEPGEKPLAAAKRELLEETGYAAKRWISCGSYVTDGNRRGAIGHLFFALGCRRRQEADSGDLEEMELVQVNPKELTRLVKRGQIATMTTLAAAMMASQRFVE